MEGQIPSLVKSGKARTCEIKRAPGFCNELQALQDHQPEIAAGIDVLVAVLFMVYILKVGQRDDPREI